MRPFQWERLFCLHDDPIFQNLRDERAIPQGEYPLLPIIFASGQKPAQIQVSEPQSEWDGFSSCLA